MSRSELSFALLVEEALVRVESSARRQLCVELLCVLATILRRNPELYLQQPLYVDKLVDDAQYTYAKVILYVFIGLLFYTSLLFLYLTVSIMAGSS